MNSEDDEKNPLLAVNSGDCGDKRTRDQKYLRLTHAWGRRAAANVPQRQVAVERLELSTFGLQTERCDFSGSLAAVITVLVTAV